MTLLAFPSTPAHARLALVDHAYQPIVSTSTLKVHGFEALARLPGSDNAKEVVDLLDDAVDAGNLRQVERTLVCNAITKFSRFEGAKGALLFCNVDNRVYDGSDFSFPEVEACLRQVQLPASNLCVEISERSSIQSAETLTTLVERLVNADVRVALDDFGVGVSSLQRLLLVEAHYVKIDRCFVDHLSTDTRKQAIVAKICGLAHALGFSTVAEGIERPEDFRAARELGCDLAQGYLIARPTTNLAELRMSYEGVVTAAHAGKMSQRVAELMDEVAPLQLKSPLSEASARFDADRSLCMLPVVDDEGTFHGALHEADIRDLLLSDFGRSLLKNRGVNTRAEAYMRRCPVGEAHGAIESIVNSYVAAEGARGLMLVHEARYVGYLSNHAVLRLAAEREVSDAREQNPLTHLPGNQSINRHITQLLTQSGPASLVFVDFDNFKAFNDTYGFAAGDRSLQLFADLLRRLVREGGAFAGHIGGDDFFIALHEGEAGCERKVRALCDKFAHDVESLYSMTDREAGGILARDRFGTERFFPLLRVSAGILHLPASRSHLSMQMVEQQLAALKSSSKRASAGLAVGRLPETAPELMRAQLSAAIGQG
jgi:EAL domain-containing protein (putative c-di-GMP-specific phosphodiesterase class I)/GGDEF domain-containing protein